MHDGQLALCIHREHLGGAPVLDMGFSVTARRGLRMRDVQLERVNRHRRGLAEHRYLHHAGGSADVALSLEVLAVAPRYRQPSRLGARVPRTEYAGFLAIHALHDLAGLGAECTPE